MDEHVSETLRSVAELYTSNLAQHGTTSKGVGWPDDQGQRLRFAKLAEVIDPAVGDYTLNDLGCGYGAMFDFLARRPGPRLLHYHGYDISAEMVQAARRLVPDARAEFVVSGQLDRVADYTVASGIFNVRFSADDASWGRFIDQTILEMAKHSRRGFAFNLLSTYVDWKKDHLFYGDPLRFFDFCKRNVSRYVTLLHDYKLYEWTIIVRMPEVAE